MEKIYIQKFSFVGFDVTMTYTKDTTRLSVLVVAFLLVGSAFTFLPAFASTGNAVTSAIISSPNANSSPPAVTGRPDVLVNTNTTAFYVDVTNPSTNAYAIVSITVLAPSGWTFSGTPTCGVDLFTLGAHSSSAVQCTTNATGLPPGFTDTVNLGDLQYASGSTASSAPVLGTFTTLVVDASSASSYAGSSFSEWDIASTSISATISGSPTTFTAGGSALTITATLGSGQAGVPVNFNFSSSTYPSSGYTSTLSPSSATTSSSGVTTSWSPSNHVPDATEVEAYIGNSAIHAATESVATVAGAPSEVSFYFKVAGTTYSTDYLTTPVSVSGTLYAEEGAGTVISMSLSDAYSNPVTLSTSIKNITLSSSGGDFYLTPSDALITSLTCGSGNQQIPLAQCQSGSSIAFPIAGNGGQTINIVQSSVYGAVGALSGIITTSSASYTGSSGNIVTSTLVSSLPTPGLPTSSAATTVAAGSSISIAEPITALSLGQEGVPVTINLCATCASTSAGYNSVFSTGTQSVTLYTNSSGWVQTSLAVNVTLNSVAVFNATALDPTTTSTTNTLSSADTGTVTTAVGAIATLVVNVASGTGSKAGHNIAYSVASGTAYVDVAYADAYGNLIPTQDAPSTQVQIGLSATNGGLLSATNVYISATDVSTNSTSPLASFGAIELTLPSTIGTSVVITATGVVSGKSVSGSATVTIVSASPSINVTAPVPVSGYLYANATEITFRGIANATAGNESTTISTIGYEVGTSGWESVATPALHNVTWAIPVVLASGLNTVTFNVTDSNSVTTVLPAYNVLVDTSAPTFSAITNANGSSTATFTITSSMGDLNASTVSAWANGTALPSSTISVTGTNNPGHAVNYTVSITGLAIGTWTLTVSARTLAGTLGSTSATITVTTPSTGIQNAFTFPPPSACTIGTYNAVCVTVTNTQAGALTGVVFAVLHNSAGQTVQVATSTVSNVAPGATTTAYVIVSVPSGSYSVNVFVWSTSGSVLSAEASPTLTIS